MFVTVNLLLQHRYWPFSDIHVELPIFKMQISGLFIKATCKPKAESIKVESK